MILVPFQIYELSQVIDINLYIELKSWNLDLSLL